MTKTWQTLKVNENLQLPGLQAIESSAAGLFSLMKPKLIIREIGEL